MTQKGNFCLVIEEVLSNIFLDGSLVALNIVLILFQWVVVFFHWFLREFSVEDQHFAGGFEDSVLVGDFWNS